VVVKTAIIRRVIGVGKTEPVGYVVSCSMYQPRDIYEHGVLVE
jgi:hypothetical protein